MGLHIIFVIRNYTTFVKNANWENKTRDRIKSQKLIMEWILLLKSLSGFESDDHPVFFFC